MAMHEESTDTTFVQTNGTVIVEKLGRATNDATNKITDDSRPRTSGTNVADIPKMGDNQVGNFGKRWQGVDPPPINFGDDFSKQYDALAVGLPNEAGDFTGVYTNGSNKVVGTNDRVLNTFIVETKTYKTRSREMLKEYLRPGSHVLTQRSPDQMYLEEPQYVTVTI